MWFSNASSTTELCSCSAIWVSKSLGAQFKWLSFTSVLYNVLVVLLLLKSNSFHCRAHCSHVTMLFFVLLSVPIVFTFTFPSVLWCCWLGLLTCKTVSRITYTVLVSVIVILSVRPSVCHTHSWTVSTRFDLRSWFLHHMVAPSF